MVVATFTFLVGVPFQINPAFIPTKSKKDKKRQDAESKKGKAGKKKGRKKNEIDEEEVPPPPEIPIDPHYIKCETIMKYYSTIRYKIFPNNETAISIVCWGKVAKIFLKEQVVPVKTIIRKNIAWVSFSIVHIFKSPKRFQTSKLLEHKIVFNVSDSESSLTPKAQEDQEQLFYTFQEEKKLGFRFEILAPTFIGEIPEIPANIKKNQKSGGEKGTSLSLSGLPSYLHRSMVVQQIKVSGKKLQSIGLPLSVEEVTERLKKKPDTRQKKRKNEKKKSSKGKRSSAKTESGAEDGQDDGPGSPLTITGEELAFDNILWFKEQYDVCLSNLYAAVWVTSDSVLPEETRNYFQPIGIRIEKLENMPILDETYKKCKKVTIEYSLGKFLENKLIRPVNVEKYSDVVHIDNTQIFLTNAIPAAQVLESFQTSKLCLKIIGYLRDSSTTYGKIFTQERDDLFFSRRNLTKMYPDFELDKKYSEESSLANNRDDEELEGVLLGYAVVDCNELIYGNYRIDISAPIMSDCPLKVDVVPSCTMGTFNNLDIYDDVPAEKGAMDDGQLIESGSSVRVLIKMLGPIKNKVRAVLNKTNFFSRMLFIFKHRTKALFTIRNLFAHNGEILGDRYLVPCIPYFKEEEIRAIISVYEANKDKIKAYASTESDSVGEVGFDEEKQRNKSFIRKKKQRASMARVSKKSVRTLGSSPSLPSTKKASNRKKKRNELGHLITGFALDSNDVILVFVEGLAEVMTTVVWNRLFSLPTEQGTILYDSELIFTERLYEDFVSIGGVYVLTLGFPFQDILRNPKAFIQGYIPTPAWKALLSIKKLLKCKNMQSAVQQDLFPTCQQIACLDLEYGLPLYRDKELPMPLETNLY